MTIDQIRTHAVTFISTLAHFYFVTFNFKLNFLPPAEFVRNIGQIWSKYNIHIIKLTLFRSKYFIYSLTNKKGKHKSNVDRLHEERIVFWIGFAKFTIKTELFESIAVNGKILIRIRP